MTCTHDLVRLRRRGAAVLFALALVGCGGEDAADLDAPAGDTAEDGAAEAATTTEPAAEPPPAIEPEHTDENGVAAVRPGEADLDCGAVDEVAPGAELAFPTDEDGMLDAGAGPVTVEFIGCSNTFEANLVYDAFHGEDRNPSLTGNTTGGTLADWAAFTFEETFWTPGEWTVVVYENDAATGERQEYDQVSFSID